MSSRSCCWLDGFCLSGDQQTRDRPSGFYLCLISKPDSYNFSQAFRLCKSGNFNLSHESVTSAEALRALWDIQQNNPEKWSKISLRGNANDTEAEEGNPDEESPFQEVPEDDSAITVAELVTWLAPCADQQVVGEHIVTAPEGHLGLAEDVDKGPRDVSKMSIAEILAEVEDCGRGKRRRFKTKCADGS